MVPGQSSAIACASGLPTWIRRAVQANPAINKITPVSAAAAITPGNYHAPQEKTVRYRPHRMACAWKRANAA